MKEQKDIKPNKIQIEEQSNQNNAATKFYNKNKKRFISKALEKYLDDKVKIEDKDLFMNNVEKIQQIIINTKDIKNFKDLCNIPNSTKNSNRKEHNFRKISFNNEKLITTNDSEYPISDFNTLKKDLEINERKKTKIKDNNDFIEEDLSGIININFFFFNLIYF
jgi:hypothetical protein